VIRYFHVIYFVIYFGVDASAQSKENIIPEWLDTIPPKILISPSKKFHSTPFYISLTTKEDAKIWIGINTADTMFEYNKNISISKGGTTIIYYYAEDIYNNKSPLDSIIYIIDYQAPNLIIKPDPGIYRKNITLTVKSDEPCRFYQHTDANEKNKILIKKPIVITNKYTGYITAEDRAGNKTRSDKLVYIIDSSSIDVAIHPSPGVYNDTFSIIFKTQKNVEIFYSLKPLDPPKWFTLYTNPLKCPYGLTFIRYFARNEYNRESSIMNATYIIDTIPPRIKYSFKQGRHMDTLTLSTKEKSIIRYSLDNISSFENSYKYKKPILLQKKGKAFIKALARDNAGNISKRFIWEYKYDKTPPRINPSHTSGIYTNPFYLTFSLSEPADIFYTLDGSSPSTNSALFKNNIFISKNGNTSIRFFAIDNADNESKEGRLDFSLDLSAPKIRIRIGENVKENEYSVTLIPNESAKIYYEIGSKKPTISSPLYSTAISMKAGQSLQYFAIDNAGNKSEIFLMEELKKPIVSPVPEGSVYKQPIKISFIASIDSDIYWRILPDSIFTIFTDSIVLSEEGTFILEYYSGPKDGKSSPIRRAQYLLDWTTPEVKISIRRGKHDSVSIFFEANENASIYYTIDGTNPLYSRSTQTAGNKFTSSKDRISIFRNREARLAFYAEDIAGNQGAISVLDIFKPRAIPSIPSGTDRVFNRILSLTLNTYDDRSQIYYERNGKLPTEDSPIFTEPITLLKSDTISAFVIDASGFKGEIESFIYLIDLPPSPQFTITPEIAKMNETIHFDASKTIDHESPVNMLNFYWDFEGDNQIDYEKVGDVKATHTYTKPGKYTVVLKVTDPQKRSVNVSNSVFILGTCPHNMVYVPMDSERSFCIDKFEWPNKHDKTPMVNVSWVRAKMYCYDEGKRLCTAVEWQYACNGKNVIKSKGATVEKYPYGFHYQTGLCPTEGDKIYKSGHFQDCRENFGTFDMVGNVWEWVEDKDAHAPLIFGGSFQFGEKANCNFSSVSSITAESEFTGFRCCK
jgi:PKD repeat protein